MGRAHRQCWDDKNQQYQHTCRDPSGRTCLGYPDTGSCSEPAGTWWTPLWCPDCDVLRQDAISRGFEALLSREEE